MSAIDHPVTTGSSNVMAHTPHVMVDIETLGTRPGSVVLSVAAVRFNARGTYAEFHRAINIFDSLMAGLTIDPATVSWWRQQSEQSRRALGFVDPLSGVLRDLTAFLATDRPLRMWAKGPDFDLVL